MASIIISGEKYNLPLGDLYVNEFNGYTDDNCILFDKLVEYGKYGQIYNLFNYITKSIMQFNDGIQVSDKLNYDEEIKKICKQMSSIDNYQKIYHDNNDDYLAINIMTDFIIKILELYKKMMNSSKVL